MFEIVPVTEKELNELRDLCIETFTETYKHLNTEANFKRYIQNKFDKAELIKDLSNKNSFTYFIKLQNENIGYLKLNIKDAQSEDLGSSAIEIERVYTLKKHFGKKVGKTMVDFAIEKGKELKKDFIWLGVWENNTRAIEFYKKQGFIKFDTHIFTLGNDEQTDHLYKLELK